MFGRHSYTSPGSIHSDMYADSAPNPETSPDRTLPPSMDSEPTQNLRQPPPAMPVYLGQEKVPPSELPKSELHEGADEIAEYEENDTANVSE